jgi:hypothetical protein
MSQALADLIEYGANVAFWSSVFFFLLTSLIWPWWRSFWGVNIIGLEIALAVALLPFVMSYDFGVRIGASPAFAWSEGTSLWLMGVFIVWRGFLVVGQQLRGATGEGLRERSRSRISRFRAERVRPGRRDSFPRRGDGSPRPGNGDGTT